ncbi:hypothetical protein B0I37DRAFT_108050 [Chaetomium sp. MPI-CAGE-AT-0009]|nr:hypothetical protein B0I37DRAFT_108050 [Chaetomium sp. MPI-CAGE-AT-0009]
MGFVKVLTMQWVAVGSCLSAASERLDWPEILNRTRCLLAFILSSATYCAFQTMLDFVHVLGPYFREGGFVGLANRQNHGGASNSPSCLSPHLCHHLLLSAGVYLVVSGWRSPVRRHDKPDCARSRRESWTRCPALVRGFNCRPAVRLWRPLPSMRLASSLLIAAITVEHVSKDPSCPHGIWPHAIADQTVRGSESCESRD